MLPCPVCCTDPGGCTILADTFDTDLSAWTNISGTWSVSGGLLEGDGVGTLLVTSEPTLTTDGVHINTSAQRESGDPATVRLIGGYDDADNYVFGEFNYNVGGNSGTIRVGKRVSGSETWLSPSITLEDDTELSAVHELEFCWKPPRAQTPQSLEATRYARDQGNTDWVDGANILGPEDDSETYYEFTGAETSGDMQVEGFGFNIPRNATIDGVVVQLRVRTRSLSGVGTLTLSSMRLVKNGTPVGDDKGTGQVLSSITFYYESIGGAADDWSASLTADDVNDADFGVVFTIDSSAVVGVDVDNVYITVYYTTASVSMGMVKLTYANTEAGASVPVQCAVGTTDYEAPGKSAGIRITAGNWDFSAFTLSYLDSPTHHPCPVCDCFAACECCDPADPASAAYIVDLGAGGLSDLDCESCDGVVGEYVLDFAFAGTVNNADICGWEYEEELDCGETLRIELSIVSGCDMYVTVWAAGLIFGYTATLGSIGTVLCTGDSPFSLDRWGKFVDAGGAHCDGDLPDPIEVSSA